VNGVIAALLGVMVTGGGALLVWGLRPIHIQSTKLSTGLWTTVEKRLVHIPRRLRWRFIVGLVLGTAMALLTGWVVLVAGVPILVVALPELLADETDRDLQLLAGLERWVRLLSGSASTGKSVLDAIRTTRHQAPEVLHDPLEALVNRLDSRWSARDAFQAFADDLDSPDADQIVAALILAAELGGTGATTTLVCLAESMQQRLRAHREIATERAKPRIVVRQVSTIIGIMLVLAGCMGQMFFRPYSSSLGQILLGVYVLAYLGSLWVLHRRSRPRARDRILVSSHARRSEGTTASQTLLPPVRGGGHLELEVPALGGATGGWEARDA